MTLQLIGAVALIPAAVYTFNKYTNSDGCISGTPVEDFIGGFFNGVRATIVGGFVVYLLIMFFYNFKAVKNKDKLKEKYICENDERTLAICAESSKITYNIAIYVILVACIISGLFSSAISITLLAVWVFIVVLRILTTNFYNSKM